MNRTISIKSIATCSFLWLLSQPLLITPLRAQDSIRRVTRPVVIKTNLTGPFSGLVEIPVMLRRSIQISVQGVRLGLFDRSRFFSLTADYCFYIKKTASTVRRPAPRGFYVGPYLKYRTVKEEKIGIFASTPNRITTYSMFGGGAVTGAQFINRWGLTIDAFLGVGYFPIIDSQVTLNTYSTEPKPQDYQLDIRPGICIGFAF
ncbi:hypothetical protein [Spirosoma validum]|uniref:DUF3575 domain-containing protein n=1 Tax=Spirosoma validum TaxID=2771355 RepID=A0A927GCD0_9BACT|nr:hypothetical protein [Spirosoma validum]MBD2752336.1 hypothetical protein [Spirosoma validum]